MSDNTNELLKEFDELVSSGMHINFADGVTLETMPIEDKIRIVEYVRELKSKGKIK